MMNIAIQGIKGSFHHIVANQYFGDEISLSECMSFVEIPELVNSEKVHGGVMAIENSLAGAILPNYALIDDFNLTIHGEVHLPIHHHLMCLKDQALQDINEVWSHPMAILQCQKFFREHPHIKLIEANDTAKVALQIQQEKLKGIAAIASKNAAEIYGLEVIADEIQTRKHNYTRFFILKKRNGNLNEDSTINKASLKFITKHQTGSLAEILHVFASLGLNLTKIQSVPIIDEPWQYAFFADVIFNNYTIYQNALSKIEKKVNSLKILGEYKRSKRNYDE